MENSLAVPNDQVVIIGAPVENTIRFHVGNHNENARFAVGWSTAVARPPMMHGAGAPTPSTVLDGLNNRLNAAQDDIRASCGRISNALSRLVPSPEPEGSDTLNAPVPPGHLNRLDASIDRLGDDAAWLRILAAQLEGIA